MWIMGWTLSENIFIVLILFFFLRPITAINFFIKNLFPYAYACRSIFAINNQFVDLYPSHISSYCRILHASLVRLSTILHKPSLEDLEHDIDYRLVSFAVKKNQSTDDSATANTRSRLIERLCTIFSRSFSSGLGSQRNNLQLANQPTRKVLCIFIRAKKKSYYRLVVCVWLLQHLTFVKMNKFSRFFGEFIPPYH